MIVQYDVESAWKGHEDFLAWLIATKRPECYVEVGVYRGFSYFAACQTIKALDIECKVFGVDTWEAGYCYTDSPEDVFGAVSAHNDQNYEAFSSLIRKASVEAAKGFKDRSIDILHIDAGHSYEEVRSDFMAWLPKMKKGGVVMFHDTSLDAVGIGPDGKVLDLGVNRFFNELLGIFPAFNFSHSCGLGVLTIDRYPA
jgi:predicted O-methyltransferase YrrM